MMPATTQGTVKLVADLVKMVEKWLLSMPEEYVGRFLPMCSIHAAPMLIYKHGRSVNGPAALNKAAGLWVAA